MAKDILASRAEAEEIYQNKDWADRRAQAVKNLQWFTGEAVREERAPSPSNETSQALPLYPLAVNIIGPQLSLNRSVTVGNQPDYDTSPVQIRFRMDDEGLKEDGKTLKTVFDRILRDSYAPSMLTEAILMMQVDGGTVLKVNWEPKSDFLKYRTRIVRYRPHQILPEYDLTDPWRMRSCYLGWEIDAEDASKRYKIAVDKSKPTVVYLEYWDKDTFKITVDGKTPPEDKVGYKMQGEHGIGRVPFIYIPHIRSGEFFGNSHVPDLTGVEIEINERYADMGDAVAEITHPVMVATDINKSGGFKLTPMRDEKNRIRLYVVNLGDTVALPGSQTPDMHYVEHSDIPDAATQYTEKIEQLAKKQGSIPKAATGDDNLSSGRKTGPVSLADMYEIVAHSQVERTDISEGIRQIVDVSLRQLMYHQGDPELADTDLPKLTPKHLGQEILTVWNPQLPLEAQQETEMINADLTAGSTSIETALRRKHVTDVEDEEARIWADLERKAKIEAKAQLEMKKMEMKAQEEMNAQKVQQEQELHEQQLGFNEQKHALDMKHKDETHKTRLASQKAAATHKE
jgi:hypothetical protein